MRRRHNTLSFSGSVHFITTVTSIRGNWFIEEELNVKLLELFEGYREKFNLDCYAYVLMPDHLHALVNQADENNGVSLLMEGFKSVSSRYYRPARYPLKSLWRRRYDDVPVPGLDATSTKIKYIHHNPVRREIVVNPEDYFWSSSRDFMGIGKGIIKLSSPIG